MTEDQIPEHLLKRAEARRERLKNALKDTGVHESLIAAIEDGLPERANRDGDAQALPLKNGRPYVQDLVVQDITDRKALGIKRYGTALQSFNGRNALQDAYEEALDLSIYLKQALLERTEQEHLEVLRRGVNS